MGARVQLDVLSEACALSSSVQLKARRFDGLSLHKRSDGHSEVRQDGLASPSISMLARSAYLLLYVRHAFAMKKEEVEGFACASIKHV